MPFQPIDFSNFAQYILQQQRENQPPDIMERFKSGYDLMQLPGQNARKREQEELANAMSRMKNEQYPENERIARGLHEAQTKDLQRKGKDPFSGTPLSGPAHDVYSIEMLRQQYGPNHPLVKQAEEQQTANMERYQFGNAGFKAQKYLQTAVAQANPHLSENQIIDATNAVLSNQTTLPDGTKLNVTPIVKNAADLALKATTTSQQYNWMVSGAQASAELPIVKEYREKALEHYGDTWGTWSTELTRDIGKAKLGDSNADNRISDWLVADMLGVEWNQIQERMNTGRVTAQGQRNLMEHSAKEAGGDFNTLTKRTQKMALDKMEAALERMYTARLHQGVSLYDALISRGMSTEDQKKKFMQDFNKKYGLTETKKDTIGPPPFSKSDGNIRIEYKGKIKSVSQKDADRYLKDLKGSKIIK